MTIRTERKADFTLLYDFVKTAFATAKVSDGTEQDFVNHLRAGAGYLPELALVAEEDGVIIGHIMLTKMQIDTTQGAHPALLLAPLSVALAWRNKGVGSALVKEALRRAVLLGYEAVFLVGDPAYYSRFGFRPTTDFDIHDTGSIPSQFIQVCELVPDALSGKSGTISIESY